MNPIKGTSKMAGVLVRRQAAKHQEPRFYTAYEQPAAYVNRHIANNVGHDSAARPSPRRMTAPQPQPQPQISTKLCTPCPYPTTYVPDVGQFTKKQYAELALHFQDQVKSLWRKVWFGLYQVQDKHGPSHASQIRKLYASAGMAKLLGSSTGQLDDMYRLFWGKWEMIGLGNLSRALCERPMNGRQQPVFGRLKIYDGIALDNLQYIVVLLKEYERQVDAMAELYSFLQQHQVHANEELTMTHQSSLLRGFRERADSMAAALSDLDEQLLVLQRDMDNEVQEIHGRLEGVETMVLMEEIL